MICTKFSGAVPWLTTMTCIAITLTQAARDMMRTRQAICGPGNGTIETFSKRNYHGGRMYSKMFPTILIVCDIFAAIGYMPCGDFRKVIYWIAAAVLTAAVTF
jgi:hypothetical protein